MFVFVLSSLRYKTGVFLCVRVKWFFCYKNTIKIHEWIGYWWILKEVTYAFLLHFTVKKQCNHHHTLNFKNLIVLSPSFNHYKLKRGEMIVIDCCHY